MPKFNLSELNTQFKNTNPIDIIKQALQLKKFKSIIVSTNFSPYEAVILHLCKKCIPDIKVLWVDSGYMLKETYEFAENTINQLDLDMHIYTPRVTRARREALHADISTILDNEQQLQEFADEVKLEPFKRAMQELNADLWITALRAEQNDFRKNLEFISQEGNIIKLNPILDWKEAELQEYIKKHNLPNETIYFDPSKAKQNRECGLHNRIQL